MQLNLIPQKDLRAIKARSFGGESFKKRRKIARPLIEGKIHHVVLKSRKATGDLSFYKHKKVVAHILRTKSREYFIELLDWVNMGNHLHLKVRFKNRQGFQNFLRVVTGVIARKITSAHRSQVFGKFWDGLAFTRVLVTKFEELGLRGYFEANHRERELGRAERDFYLQQWNQFLNRLRRRRRPNGYQNLLDSLG